MVHMLRPVIKHRWVDRGIWGCSLVCWLLCVCPSPCWVTSATGNERWFKHTQEGWWSSRTGWWRCRSSARWNLDNDSAGYLNSWPVWLASFWLSVLEVFANVNKILWGKLREEKSNRSYPKSRWQSDTLEEWGRLCD